MRVTNIKKNKSNFDIYLDGELAFTLTDEGVYNLGIKINQDFIIDKEKNDIIKEDEFLQCKRKAFYIISRYSKTEKALTKKLESYDFSNSSIIKTIEYLKENEYINDSVMANELINNEIKKNKSINQMKQKLFERGINSAEINRYIANSDINEKKSAYNIALKKYKTISSKDKYEIINKIKMTLSYRRFSYESINFAVNKIREIIDSEW